MTTISDTIGLRRKLNYVARPPNVRGRLFTDAFVSTFLRSFRGRTPGEPQDPATGKIDC